MATDIRADVNGTDLALYQLERREERRSGQPVHRPGGREGKTVGISGNGPELTLARRFAQGR